VTLTGFLVEAWEIGRRHNDQAKGPALVYKRASILHRNVRCARDDTSPGSQHGSPLPTDPAQGKVPWCAGSQGPDEGVYRP
jgi:hypothetical protein